ncbi:MAG TPA: TIM barrel protein [Vicinamibacteria bacterium]|nr:TIM barrel protein [Vicinamibacteria bacterium]
MARAFERGRRDVLRGGAALAAAALGMARRGEGAGADQGAGPAVRGRLKQSVSRWCFGKMSLDELCGHAARIGYRGIDLLGPADWPVVRKHGLVCPLAMLGAPVTIDKGLNRVENHGPILDALGEAIDLAAEAQVPNIVCFSGNRAGLSDEEGLENCARGLRQIAPHAEQKGVTLCVELLNSKVDHKDYMCDHTAWGLALVKKVGSPRVKLLYDIYHMQIMEGDVIRTIRESIASIAHFHTAGVPGRHEIDGRQELNYPAICRAIVESGYSGFLAQEFVPTDEPLRALEEAFRICDV